MGSSRGPFRRVSYAIRSQWCNLILMVTQITDRCLFNKLFMLKKRGKHQRPVLLSVCRRNAPVHGDVIKWKHFPRYWPFVRGIHRSPLNSPHKVQWRGAFDVFFDLRLNKRLNKQSQGWWFETPSFPLWRHCNAQVDSLYKGPVTCKVCPCDDDHLTVSHSGTLFTNKFSSYWKVYSALIQVFAKWSLWNFAHSTTAVLSWHV